ncbi:MAG: hypothetical protein HKL95_07315 [Phycisphaerae bacterium]|nr:hypothetical protein [Phycisphaerae bacterium]
MATCYHNRKGIALKNTFSSSNLAGFTQAGANNFAPARRRGLLPRTFTGWLLTLLVLALILWGFTWLLMLATPPWYRPMNPNSQLTQHQAGQAQAALLNLRNSAQDPTLSRITWRITAAQINSLLALAYGQTSGSAHPAEPAVSKSHGFQAPFVRLQNGKITIAAVVHTAIGNSVASATISVATLPHSMTQSPLGRLVIESLHLGLAPLPPTLITSRLSDVLPHLTPSIQRMIAMYAGAGYARTAGPQVIASIRDILAGKPFPLTISFRYRRVTITNIQVLGAHTSVAGGIRRRRPAEILIKLRSD